LGTKEVKALLYYGKQGKWGTRFKQGKSREQVSIKEVSTTKTQFLGDFLFKEFPLSSV